MTRYESTMIVPKSCVYNNQIILGPIINTVIEQIWSEVRILVFIFLIIFYLFLNEFIL